MSSFICVLASKSLEIGSDHKLHKANRAEALQRELEGFLEPLKGQTPTVQVSEGGALAGIGDDVVTAHVGDRIAVFQGLLRNIDQLRTVYGPHAQTPSRTPNGTSANGAASSSSEAEDDSSQPSIANSPTLTNGHDLLSPAEPLNAAELICYMYEKVGVGLLRQLVGKFCVCMYDAKQMRVLAARDGAGETPMLEARSGRESLILTTNASLITTCQDTVEFEPGFFKYGWHAAPRLFTSADAGMTPALPSRRSSVDQHGSRGPSRRNSIDHRRSIDGKQMLSPASSVRRSIDGRRTSIDANGRGTPNGSSSSVAIPVPGGSAGRTRSSGDHSRSFGDHGSGLPAGSWKSHKLSFGSGSMTHGAASTSLKATILEASDEDDEEVAEGWNTVKGRPGHHRSSAPNKARNGSSHGQQHKGPGSVPKDASYLHRGTPPKSGSTPSHSNKSRQSHEAARGGSAVKAAAAAAHPPAKTSTGFNEPGATASAGSAPPAQGVANSLASLNINARVFVPHASP